MLKFIGGVVIFRIFARIIGVAMAGGLIYLMVQRVAGARDVAG